MAECIRYQCGNCDRGIDAWSDGNPYFINDEGQKQYAHHPHHEDLAKCVGNDVPFLCLDCGEEFEVDSRSPDERCRSCRSAVTAETTELEGKRCPYCKNGSFEIDADFFAVS